MLRDVLPYAAAAAVGLVYFRLAVILHVLRRDGVRDRHLRRGVPDRRGGRRDPVAGGLLRLPDRRPRGRERRGRLRYALQRMFEVSAMLGAFIALGLALGAEFAIEVVGGEGFEDAVVVLRLLALGLVSAFLVATWSYALLSLRMHGALAGLQRDRRGRGDARDAVVLGAAYGAEGAAVATVGAEVVLAISYLVALRRRRPGLAPRSGYYRGSRWPAVRAPLPRCCRCRRPWWR